MTQGQEFRDIYQRLAVMVSAAGERHKLRRPQRDPSVADASVLCVPREVLLAIEDDESFVASCFLVLLDVAPTARQTRSRVRSLRDGARTRAEVLDQIVTSQTMVRSGRKVIFT